MAEVVRDDPKAIADALASALGADVVISSGGVSVGPHDYVKPALLGLGVEEVFWRVAHKPGKPLWFGVADSGALVFGVPGNPVSSLVCFELFIRPALLADAGGGDARAAGRAARPVGEAAARSRPRGALDALPGPRPRCPATSSRPALPAAPRRGSGRAPRPERRVDPAPRLPLVLLS